MTTSTDTDAPLADPTPLWAPDSGPPPVAAKPIAPARILAAAAAAGIALDRLPSGAIGYGTTLLVLAVPILLVASGSVRTRWGWIQLVPIAAIAPWLSLRANVTIQILDIAACAGLVLLGVTSGPIAKRLAESPDRARRRPTHGAWSLVDGPRFAGAGLQAEVLRGGEWVKSLVRGLLVVFPVAAVVTVLLATADDSFSTVLEAASPVSVGPHLMIGVVGALVFAGLARAATTPRAPLAWTVSTVGRVEVAAVLAAFAAIFGLFVAARLVDPAGKTDDPFALADEARAGFFQLVAVVAITVLVLGSVRAVAGRPDRVVNALALAVVALTLALVGIALHRLARYRDEFGLTELRLGTTWFSVWLGVVVVIVGASFVVPVRAKRFVVAIAVSALTWLVGWNAINPDQRIAVTNLDRATDTDFVDEHFDSELIGSLSADAMPAIMDRVGDLNPFHREAVLALVCDGRHASPAVGLDANAAIDAAHEALEGPCVEHRSGD